MKSNRTNQIGEKGALDFFLQQVVKEIKTEESKRDTLKNKLEEMTKVQKAEKLAAKQKVLNLHTRFKEDVEEILSKHDDSKIIEELCGDTECKEYVISEILKN